MPINFDTPKSNLLAKYEDEYKKYIVDPKYASQLIYARKMAHDAIPKNEKEPAPEFDKAFNAYEDLIIAIRKERAFAPPKKPVMYMKWIIIIVAVIIVLLAIIAPLVIYFKKEHVSVRTRSSFNLFN